MEVPQPKESVAGQLDPRVRPARQREAYRKIRPQTAAEVSLTGGGFLVMHALVHVCDTVAGREHAHQVLGELPTVFLPGVLVIWLAWSARHAERE
jgi:hypothetical protein